MKVTDLSYFYRMQVPNFKSIRLLFFVGIIFLFASTHVKAQLVQRFSIHFESNSEKLSKQSVKSIDSVLAKLTNNPLAYKVELIGHADSSGSAELNQLLSLKRAKETAKYFKSKDFSEERISCSGQAFNAPLTDNSTDEKKFRNRRVEIKISVDLPKAPGVGGLKLTDDTYTFSATDGTIIIYPTGTQIGIEPNSYVDKNGKLITGTIQIVYKEYRKTSDFILAGIPMDYFQNNERFHFNSAGMFKMFAYQNGVPVYLKPKKEIKINFPLEKDIPDLNFYRLDTVSGRWAELAKLYGYGSGFDLMHGGHGGMLLPERRLGPCEKLLCERSCSMNDCQALFYSANVGTQLASSEKDFSRYIGTNDSTSLYSKVYCDSITFLEKSIRDLEVKIYHLDQKKNKTQHTYTLQKITDRKNSLRIVCKNSRENEINALKNSTWTFASKEHQVIEDSMYKVKWRSCKISSPDNELYSIELSRTGEESYVISGLKMKLKDKVRRKKRPVVKKKLFQAYDSTMIIYQDKLSVIQDEKDSLGTKKEELKDLLNALNDRMTIMDSDSLCCFWNSSRSYMSKEELKLPNLRSWMLYFTSHKSEMLTRYQNLKDSTYERCKKMEEERIKAERIAMEKAIERKKIVDKAESIFKELSISRLGVYNCDAISRLTPPVVQVLANYSTKKKKKLNVVLIYLIDDSFNGILRYDGNYGLGPNLFKYSASSRTTLVAFDEFFNPYIFKPENFKTISVPNNKLLEYTFQLEPIGKLQDQDELDELVK